jgi:ABC-type transport system involved in cytochrome c biogenesis permease component
MSHPISLFKKDKRHLFVKYPNLKPVLIFILIIVLVFSIAFSLNEQSIYTIGRV